jgi:MoaA/NifB/PqqE/SkfB family radical SAM enzyme
VWKNPTRPDYELDIETLKKLPAGFDFVNITGGEPTLRRDLLDICHVLAPKTKTLEISTNGLHGDVLKSIVRTYPDIKIRNSVEGPEEKNDMIREERNGFEKKLEAMRGLVAVGGIDLRFATSFLVFEHRQAARELYSTDCSEFFENGRIRLFGERYGRTPIQSRGS